jgi:hypothetical protein
MLSVQTGFRGSSDLRIGGGLRPSNCFFSPGTRAQISYCGHVFVRRGQIRRIGWVIKKLEAQVGQFLLGCKYSVGRGIIVQEQDPPW